MTITSPRLRDWLPTLLSGRPHQVIGGPDDPYLLRWYVIPRNPVLNVYVHKFCRSDDDRALHDHPWWFVSLMLRGSYSEVTEDARTRRTAPEPLRLFWGDSPVAFRRAEWRHRVQLMPLSGPDLRKVGELPCWTLIVTGRRVRTWGFWCKQTVTLKQPDHPILNPEFDVDLPDRFIPWDEFGDAGCGELS